MNIIGTQFSLSTNSLDIYLAGCNGPHCGNCHNPETWDFANGNHWKERITELKEKVQSFNSLVKNFMILGGEPTDHPEEELVDFILKLHGIAPDVKIWLFTRREFEEVGSVKHLVDYIKCGRYEFNQTPGNMHHGIKLASWNQRIYKRGEDY